MSLKTYQFDDLRYAPTTQDEVPSSPRRHDGTLRDRQSRWQQAEAETQVLEEQGQGSPGIVSTVDRCGYCNAHANEKRSIGKKKCKYGIDEITGHCVRH